MINALRPYGPLAQRSISRNLVHRSLQPFTRPASTHSKLFQVAEEVEYALQTGQPVVALETTIYTHGILSTYYELDID